jgi:hypothetical protein
MMSFAGKWMEPEMLLLKETNQAQKVNYHMFPLICGTWT